MATEKWVARLEAKLDALLEAHDLKPTDYAEPVTIAGRPPRTLTAAEQQAIDNAPKTPVGANGPATSATNPAPATPPAEPAQPAATGEPWEGYDDASADDIVARLRGMDKPTRDAALAYERKNRNRVTITRVQWNS